TRVQDLEVQLLGRDRRLELQYELSLEAMRQRVVPLPVRDRHRRDEKRIGRQRLLREPLVDDLRVVVTDRARQRLIEQLPRVDAEPLKRVAADLRDPEVRLLERQQHAMRLDTAGDVDGLSVATGK